MQEAADRVPSGMVSALLLERAQVEAVRAFHEVGRQFEYCEEGGAPLLGIDGVCIICHGSSNAVSITNALRVARTMRDREINARITADLGEE
jgi:glycerol-3-phosphate acyltransferase PlsX